MLVVISIIALLMSILIPSLSKAKLMAIRLDCANNLRQINLAMNLYLDGNDNKYPCAGDPLPQGYWLWMGRGWRFLIRPYLEEEIDADNPSVLWCSQDPIGKEKYESTSYAYSMAFYHSPQQIDAMGSTADQWGSASPLSVTQSGGNVANPSGKILIGEWLSNHFPVEGTDSGWWCWKGSRNYLFADGQVRYLKVEQINPARDNNPNPNLTFKGIKGTDWPLKQIDLFDKLE